ncbi:MAG: hypothetical protein Q9180_002083, partial [Flavoplaca navasiana]
QQNRRYSNQHRHSPYPSSQSPRSYRYDAGSDVDRLIDEERSRASESRGDHTYTASPSTAPGNFDTVRTVPQRISSSSPVKKEPGEDPVFLSARQPMASDEDKEYSPAWPKEYLSTSALPSTTTSGNQVDSSRDPRIRRTTASSQQVPTHAKDSTSSKSLQKALSTPLMQSTNELLPAPTSDSYPAVQWQLEIVPIEPTTLGQHQHDEDEVGPQCRTLEYLVRQLCSLTYCSEIPAMARIAEVYNAASTHYSRVLQSSPHDPKIIESNLRQVQEARDRHQSA